MTDIDAADRRYRAAQVAFENALYATALAPAEAAAVETELYDAWRARREAAAGPDPRRTP